MPYKGIFLVKEFYYSFKVKNTYLFIFITNINNKNVCRIPRRRREGKSSLAPFWLQRKDSSPTGKESKVSFGLILTLKGTTKLL